MRPTIAVLALVAMVHAGPAAAQPGASQIRDAFERGGGACPSLPERIIEYPPSAMRNRQEGRVVVGLCVSPEGAPTSFKMLSLSGVERLDIATAIWACQRRYFPAINAEGERVSSCAAAFDYTWRLADYPRPAAGVTIFENPGADGR